MTKEQILKEFEIVSELTEAKKVYRRLAKILHPDMECGDTESFKILNSVYTDLIEHKIYFSNDIEIDIELEKIISLILHFENITIQLIGKWVWVSNINYTDKAIISKLKELGFRWARKKKMWHFSFEKIKNGGKTKSMEDIKNKYGSHTMKNKSQVRLN